MKNRKKYLSLVLTLAILLGSVVTGCAKRVPLKPVAEGPQWDEVSFPEEIDVSPNFIVTDAKDAKQMILFGIKLYDAELFNRAYDVFIEASRIESVGHEFEKRALAAAALSRLMDGKLKEFSACVRELGSNYLNKHERVSPGPELAGIIALDRFFRGESFSSIYGVPADVKGLISNLSQFK